VGKSRVYSLKEQVGYLFSGKVFALLIQMLLSLILVRLIDKEAYGVYLQLLFISQLLVTILSFSIPASLYFFYPNAKEQLGQLISQTFFATVGIGLLFLLLYYFFGHNLDYFFKNKVFSTFFYALGSLVVFTTITTLLEHLFVVEKKSNYVVYYNVLFTGFRVLFLICSFLIFRSILAMIWALVVFQFLNSVFLFIYLRENYSISLNIKNWSKTYFLQQLKYVIPLGISNTINIIGKQSQRIFLSVFFSSSDFAVYSIANFKVPIINLLFPSVSNVIVPQISKNRADGNSKEVVRLWHKMIVVLSMVTFPTVIYFVFIAEPLITFLFTNQYVSAADIYRILMLSMLTLNLRGTTIIMAYGYTNLILYSQIAYMILSVIVGYFLIRTYGLYGAAVTFVSLNFLREFAFIYMSKLILKLSFYRWMPWKKTSRLFLISAIPAPFLLIIINSELPKFVLLIISFLLYSGIVLTLYEKFKIIDFSKIVILIKERVRVRDR